jgi:hypothetical protein
MAANTTAMSILDEPVDYRDLKEWIEEQERNPKPLTPLQQRAIADLRRSIEPEIGARDWVSLMNRTSNTPPTHSQHPSLTTLTRILPSPRQHPRLHRRAGPGR